MTKVFLDADVLLDLFIEREPHHTIALRLFTDLKRTNAGCFTSPVVLANMNYILAKAKGRDYSLGRLRSLRRMVGIAPIDEAMVDAALAAPQRDLEDSIQLHCAEGSRIPTIITRNVKHYPKGRLQVTSPLEYLSSKALGKSG
jgi:predicted nucleic acid-binding protein